MLGVIFTIARNTFLESVRQPIYFILVALAGVFQVFTTWTAAFSMGYTESAEVSSDDQMMLGLSLGMAMLIGMLLAAFLATSVISKEIERKTVLTVVSKPVPRPSVVLGKYLGVATAIAIAMVTILLFALLGVRHGVLMTAGDTVDQPVPVFSFAAVVVAFGVGTWGNYFYGWVFSQTTTLLLCPLMLLAYVLVLMVSKKWHIQPLATDLKPQIMMTCVAILLSQLVMTAIATAASARLGQVMTIVICSAALVLGLSSNHFLGRRAVQNTPIARIESGSPVMPSRPALQNNSDEYDVVLELDPRTPIRVGSPFYYGPNPSGLFLATSPYTPFKGDLKDMNQVADRKTPAALVVESVEKKKIRLIRVGAGEEDGVKIASRVPRPGDYVFLKPTRVSRPFLAAWGAVPDMQFFWLTDAVTQHQDIPPRHLGLVALYALLMIGAFLSLAVALFQKREVG